MVAGKVSPDTFSPQNRTEHLKTTILCHVPGPGEVELTLYNALGQEIRKLFHGVQSGGSQSIVWDGRDAGGRLVPGGTYFYILRQGERFQTRKLVVVR